jgi:hypothetical protein
MPSLRVLLLLPFLVACASAPTPRTIASDAAPTLLAALDGEALYTLASGLKPVSEGFWQTWIEVDAPELEAVARVRRALAAWRTESLWADVHVFHQVHDGKRAALAYVVDRTALAALIAREARFFAGYGLMPDTHPSEVIAVVERMPPLDRHRGQGLLFGYPQHAIDFFVAAEAAKPADGKPLPRRFVAIPTFAAATGRFVYAVAAGAPDRAEDAALAAAAAPILARWRELRQSIRTEDPTALSGAVAVLRREFAAAPVLAAQSVAVGQMP